MSGPVWRSIEQADNAFLERDGVAYRCYVWQRNAEYTETFGTNFRGSVIEARIDIEQPNGTAVVLWQGIVRTPIADHHIDSPRVVPRGTTFACHWIEYDDAEAAAEPPSDNPPADRDLHRATFDVERSVYTWEHQGSIPTSPYHLYDIHQDVEGEDYALAHLADVDTLSVRRVNGDEWIDTAWTVSVDISTAPADEPVLAVAKLGTSNALALWQSRDVMAGVGLDWSDGSTEILQPALLPEIGEFTAVGICRGDGASGEAFVVAEFLPEAGFGAPDYAWTVHFETNATSLTPLTSSGYTETPGTTLSSKPWRYTSGASVVGDVPQFFAALSHMQSRDGAEYQQANHYMVRYERAASEFAGRPIVVGIMNQGLASAERHGTHPPTTGIGLPVATSTGDAPRRRRNHLPHATRAPSFGPLMKSYTTVLGRWSRIEESFEGVTPAGAAFRAARFHHEDPWLVPNDESDPTAGTENYAATSVPQLQSVEAGAGLFVAGGCPQSYDGSRFVEVGFPWNPEVLLVEDPDDPEDNTDGPGDPGDVYFYTAVYEWRDARGQLHRSAPAAPFRYTAADHAPHVSVATVSLSMKDNSALDAGLSRSIKIAIYRTAAGGTTFYALYNGLGSNQYQTHDAPANDPTTDHITIVDNRADAEITPGEVLPYTFADGAWTPLPPEPVPAMTVVAQWQNRVWGVAAEEPNRIWYSQEILPEFGGEQFSIPEFSSDLTYRVDGIGTITALVPMDNALIVFTRNAIYSLAGLPADANGLGATLQLQVLQRHTGCIAPQSVASATDGIYFQARRGFYHLSRGNQLSYIGAPVEDEVRAAGLIRAVTVHEDSHQVRLLVNGEPTGDPRVLVYDTLMQMWSEWPLPELASTSALSTAQDAVVWRGHDGELAHVVLAQGGLAVQKATTSPTRYADEAAGDPVVAIPVDIRTDWIKLAGIAGFKRCRKIGLQLTKPAAAPFTVQVEYDLDGTFTDGANLQTFTVDATTRPYVELRPRIQKCSALRIRVFEGSDDPTGDQLTESTMNLHAITLVVARKPGLRRVSPTTQRP